MSEGELEQKIWVKMPSIALAILEEGYTIPRSEGKSERLKKELEEIDRIIDEARKDFPTWEMVMEKNKGRVDLQYSLEREHNDLIRAWFLKWFGSEKG
jgi:hypothetical protein